MEPLFGDSTRIRVARRVALPGDVVAIVDQHGQIVVHRLLGFRLSWGKGGRPRVLAVTAADRGVKLDTPVARDRMLGVLVGIESREHRVGFRDRLAACRRYLHFGIVAMLRRRRGSGPGGPQSAA